MKHAKFLRHGLWIDQQVDCVLRWSYISVYILTKFYCLKTLHPLVLWLLSILFIQILLKTKEETEANSITSFGKFKFIPKNWTVIYGFGIAFKSRQHFAFYFSINTHHNWSKIKYVFLCFCFFQFQTTQLEWSIFLEIFFLGLFFSSHIYLG